jgi:hypothetical protein
MARNEELKQQVETDENLADDDPKIFNLRIFGWVAVLLVGMIAFVLLSGALLSGFFLPGHYITIPQAPTVEPPAPRLQPNPAQDFQAFYATQQAELDSYGWVDQKRGIVHIPIEQAMEKLSEQNLPLVTGTAPATPEAP